MKKNKGITMISLVITIIVLLIVTSITIGNGLGQLGIKRVNNLYADIESISTKVAEYYLKNGTLPVYDNLYVNNKQELEELFKKNGATENITNVNDGDEYYVINPTKLDNLTLNYGDDYKEWTNTSTSEEFQNIYIINSVTHQIYFPHGVRSGDEYFFARFPDENEITAVELGEIEGEWNFDIVNISANNIDENNISVVADITLTGLGEKYDLNSFKYAWLESNEELESENTIFTNFRTNNTNEENMTATLASKPLSNTAEYYYLWIKAVDINGKISQKYLMKSASPLTGNLPSNYQRVEYLESTGKQYIDTGLKLNKNSGYYIDFVPEENITSTKAPNYINAGGAGGDINTRVGISVYPTKTNGELQFFNYKIDPKISKNNRAKMSIINKTVTYNDGSTVLLNNVNVEETSNSLIIFAAHTEPIERFSNMKLYNLKIYNLNEVIRNYIPCYRKSDNVKGLYDLIEGGFYKNLGNGDDFIAGEDIF